MKAKKIAITIVVIAVVCVIGGSAIHIHDNRYTVPDDAKNISTVKSAKTADLFPKLARLDVKCYKMEKAGTKSNIYIMLYKSVETAKITGADKAAALDEAVNSYVFSQSIMWYAKSAGLQATDKELNSYYVRLSKDITSAKEGKAITEEYKKAGLTMKDIILSETYGTRFGQTYDNVYNYKNDKFTDDSTVTDTDKEWKKFEKLNLQAYLKSAAFDKLEPELKTAEKAVKADEGI